MKNERYNTHVPYIFPIERAIMKCGKAQKNKYMPPPPRFSPVVPPRHALKTPLARINVQVRSF